MWSKKERRKSKKDVKINEEAEWKDGRIEGKKEGRKKAGMKARKKGTKGSKAGNKDWRLQE